MNIRLISATAVVLLVGSTGCGGKKFHEMQAPLFKASVSKDGRQLTVQVGADPCSHVRKSDVHETDSAVIVAVYMEGSGSKNSDCATLSGVTYPVAIHLRRPLGSRQVKTTGGDAIPLSAP